MSSDKNGNDPRRITKIPDKLEAGSDRELEGTAHLKKLPDKFDDSSLEGTAHLKKLPDKFDDSSLEGTAHIKKLPDTLEVGSNPGLEKTHTKRLKEIRPKDDLPPR